MIINVLIFLLGMQYMIMVLAALYRYVDLWYRIADSWVGITARLVVLIGLGVLLYWLLQPGWSEAFIYGQLTYLFLHVVGFWIIRFGLILMESRSFRR